jgi:hypothetical protein
VGGWNWCIHIVGITADVHWNAKCQNSFGIFLYVREKTVQQMVKNRKL